MALQDVLKHRAVPLYREPGSATWSEGERVPAPVTGRRGTPFACALFVGRGESVTVGPEVSGGHHVTRPQLLYDGTDEGGGQVALSPEDDLLIVAEELNVGRGLAPDAEVRYQVDGSPWPFGKPGEPLKGLLAYLTRVEAD